ncbi:hypothetical protein FF1_011427 [Malus domestica]
MKGEKGAHHLASELVAPSPTFLLIPWHWLALCSVLHCAFLYHSCQHLHPHSLHLDPYQVASSDNIISRNFSTTHLKPSKSRFDDYGSSSIRYL